MSVSSPPDVMSMPFQQAWADGISSVLAQLSGSPFPSSPLKDENLNPSQTTTEKGAWVRFVASGKLTGELGFFCAFADAMRLAHLLTADTYDPNAIFSDAHRDAFSEVFQQFAGVVATSCKKLYGGEVQFSPNGAEQPAWQWAAKEGSQFQGGESSITIHMFLSPELEASVRPEISKADTEAPARVEQKKPEEPKAEPEPEPQPQRNDANLSLLLDVELEASLRFGQRQMLLREILDLRPGFVIELDRRLQEPADLLVAGRLVARGEVVIVDGNYGLRITEIIRPQDRLESVKMQPASRR